MYERVCSNTSCTGVLPYDGQQDGYLVVSPTEVWDLHVLYSHYESLHRTGNSFDAVAYQLNRNYLLRGWYVADGRSVCVLYVADYHANDLLCSRHNAGEAGGISRHKYGRAFWAFLALIEDVPREHMQCIQCGDPEKVRGRHNGSSCVTALCIPCNYTL